MKPVAFRSLMILAVLALLGATTSLARELAFEERVQAQEAIERVYYSHEIGVTLPFEEALPREVLENKVHTYLRQSAALEAFWHTPVTGPMLQKELQRIVRDTKLPGRLREIFDALGNDSLLIQECLVRPTLVDQLARSFFAEDTRIHGATRAEAESLRAQLLEGKKSVDAWDPHRTILPKYSNPENDAEFAPGTFAIRGHLHIDEARRLNDETRRRNHSSSGGIGLIRENKDAFVFYATLSDEDDSRLAGYIFPKSSWDSWWASQEMSFGESFSSGDSPDSVSLASLPGSSDFDSPNCIQADTWNNGRLDAVPQVRGGPTLVWTGSLVLMWGGAASDEPTNTGAKYDPLTDSWAPMSSVRAPVGRYSHTAVWTGGEMIIWGGWSGQSYQNTGGRYNPSSDTWATTSTTGAPLGRGGHTAVWTGERMVVWGGGNSNQFLNTGGIYDPGSDTWIATSMVGVPSPRAGHAVVWTGQAMIVWGGSDWVGFYPVPPASLSTGGRFDPVHNTWQPTAVDPLAGGRGNLSAVWSGSEMLIWGGFSAGKALSTGARYDPVQDQWRSMSAINQPSPRWAPDFVWTGSEMIVWGGIDESFNPRSGGRYNPSTDQWTAMSTGNSPSLRLRLNAVWTGTFMITWGGFESPIGGRYDPVADAWTSMSEKEMVPPVAQPAVVWTGSELVVWGGMSILNGYESHIGSRYDPVIDRWSPISIANAPPPTKGAAALWTGSEMLVWGGFTNQGLQPVSGGGRYDPRTDTWGTITQTGAPSIRRAFSSIWTGSRMIIWGGFAPYTGGPMNTGASYNPLTNTWNAISTVNAPVGREGHSAVWSGTEMLVWGGKIGAGLKDDGGRYDPALDRWMPLPQAGAPAARQAHSAVWTGSEMLVWGGITQIYPTTLKTSTGGRYNPATDSWMPLPTEGAPRERTEQTAVWTGREMIIWGGRIDNQATNAGAAYDPSRDAWRTLSLLNAPEPRWDHVAVWTGEMMIIWGGPYRRYVASGGRYFPDPVVDRVTADAGEDETVECAHPNGTPLTVSAHGGTCGDPARLRYTWRGSFAEGGGTVEGASPTLTLPLGDNVLHLRVEDDQGHSAEDEMVVAIRDTTAPDLTCPIANAMECASPSGTPVLIPTPIMADACDPNPIVANSHGEGGPDASGVYPLGQTEVTLTATDSSGNQAACAFPIVVKDTTPPQITLTPTPSMLWPPNHRMVDVTAPVTVTDRCSSPSVVLDSITSSELDDAPGSSDGNTSGDIQGATPGSSDFAFQLRAERDGAGGGRFYRVTYSAIDTTGNRSTSSALILVPHDQGGVTEPVVIKAREEPKSTTFSWNAVPDAEAYGMIRGEVGELREVGSFIDLGSVSCIYPSGNLLTAERADSQIPPPGRAYFYLVSYSDGMDSGYGTDTVSKPRIRTSGGCDATGIPLDPNSIAGGTSASSTGDRLKTLDSP